MPNTSEHRLCVAPMMDWTDRHCRYFLRLVTRHARLYTEMVTTGALLHGDVPRHLDFSDAEHPVALQLGGSDPAALAHCAKLGERWGYDEINLNVGCPSERVQTGSFGACLMAEPALVGGCVRAMRDAVAIPVTVKHRIGLDRNEDYAFVRDFVGTVAEAGCDVFIVHARNAVLKGLSPKENREVPPLDYDRVFRLKADRPQLEIAAGSAQARVFSLQRFAGRETVLEPAPGGGRGTHGELDGVGGGLQDVAHPLEVVPALVQVHGHHRQHRVEGEAKAGATPPVKRPAGSCAERGHSVLCAPRATQGRSVPGPVRP